MSKREIRHFTREYKEEALRLWAANGGRTQETANQLGIVPAYLAKWRHQLQRADRSGAKASVSGGQPVACDMAAENAQLKRENARLKIDYEILKKTVAIFSKETHK